MPKCNDMADLGACVGESRNDYMQMKAGFTVG